MSKSYESPQVYLLGTVQNLTQQGNKCAGSGDLLAPQQIEPFGSDSCPPVQP
jgi:hypothetical protein